MAMPDEAGKLSAEDISRFLQVLNAKGIMLSPCSACRQTTWTPGQHLVAPPLFAGGNMMLGGVSYPQAMLICVTCGHTLYFLSIRDNHPSVC
jgi:hypothetical protein